MRNGPVLVGTAAFVGGSGISDDSLNLLEPMPMRVRGGGTTRSSAHSLQLHLVPFLQIIDLVLTLLHTLVRRLALISAASDAAAAPISHSLRHFLPIPPAKVPAVQLVVLLRVRLQQTRDRRVRPLLAVLPVRLVLRLARVAAFVLLVVVVGRGGPLRRSRGSGRPAGPVVRVGFGVVEWGFGGVVRGGVVARVRVEVGVRVGVGRGGRRVDERKVVGRGHRQRRRRLGFGEKE